MFRVLLSCLFACALLAVTPALADDPPPPDHGTLGDFNVYNVEYKLTGVEMWKSEDLDVRHRRVYCEATAAVVAISGIINISASPMMVNEFKAHVIASTKEKDANGTYFGHPGYNCDGPQWEWSGSLDGRNIKEKITDQVPFSLSIPIPGYDYEAGVTHVFFEVQVDCYQYDWRWGDPDDPAWNYTDLSGTIRIPEEFEPQPMPVLSMKNGGELSPLKLKLKLMDNSEQPPKPLKDTVVKLTAPVPSKPANVIKDYFSKADWKLSGYFRSKTKCPNCDWTQAGSQYTSDIVYYLKTPGEPIEVLTDDNGEAEVEFYLDLPALGDDIPRHDRPLTVPITAEYFGTDGDSKGKLLADTSLSIKLKDLGYVVAVTYVQPQEWEPWGGLGDYKPASHNTAEYPLDTYYKDEGTGLPYDDVRGSDRARITPSNSIVAPDYGGAGVAGDSLNLQPTAPSAQLKPGMLFGYGDRIDIDARGLLRLKPLDKQDPAYGITGKPGWVWVTVKFFDGMKGKIGVSGVCERHSVIMGRTPEESGWVPTSKSFVYWAAGEAVDCVVAKMIPIYGQVDLVCDIAGYINWSNHGEPAFIRVESGFHAARQDDGSVLVTVREGHPSVVTRAAGFAGVKAEVGQMAAIAVDNTTRVQAASPGSIARADELLGGLNTAVEQAADIEPVRIELDETGAAGDEPVSSNPFDGYEGTPEDYFGGEDPPDDWYSGDVPLDEIDGIVDIEPTTTYRFDEFSMDVTGNWVYDPESDDSFAMLGNDDIALYLVVIRADIRARDLLGLMELEYGEPEAIQVDGEAAQWFPLLEEGEAYGGILCFDRPLKSGNRLYVHFISDASIWPLLVGEVYGLFEGMRFE